MPARHSLIASKYIELEFASVPVYKSRSGIGTFSDFLSQATSYSFDEHFLFAWVHLGSSQIHTTPDNGHTMPSDERTVSGDPMDICIIGGGATGLSALQVIMGTPQYKSGHWKPTLFEARDKPGGVW